MRILPRCHAGSGLLLATFVAAGAASATAQNKPATDKPDRVDYLTFAQGAIPGGSEPHRHRHE